MSEYFYGDSETARPAPAARLRARAQNLAHSLAARFAPAGKKAGKKTAGASGGAPPDPAMLLFPAGPDAGADARSLGDAPLRERLDESAENIARHDGSLGERAAPVWAAIMERRDGHAASVAYFLRLMIAFAFAGIALHLDRAGLTDGLTIFGAMQVGETGGVATGGTANHAALLGRVFFGLGALYALGALIGMTIVALTGNADNRKTQARARDLGLAAADIARDFDRRLSALRAAMDRHHDQRRPAQAVRALSQGHLVALEAATLFRMLGILNETPGAGAPRPEPDALDRFAGYLRGEAQKRSLPADGGVASLAAGLGLGFMFGFAYAYLQFAPPPPEPAAVDTVRLATLYPAAGQAILALTFAYAFAGWLCRLLRPAIAADAARQAVIEALDAARSPFTGDNAPRMDDIARRIEDALAVYIAWVEGQPRRTASAASAAGSEGDAVPRWRRAPEGPRFVETGFQAAPKAFLAGRAGGEGFEGGEENSKKPSRETGPKRSLSGLFKPPGT